MLIATTNVDIRKCFSLRDDVCELNSYIRSLIPEKYAHLNSIFNNQKYYICCKMFESTTNTMEEKKELNKALMSGTKVIGIIDTFIPMTEVECLIDEVAVKDYREESLK